MIGKRLGCHRPAAIYLSICMFAALLIGLAAFCRTGNSQANVLADPIKIDTGYVAGTLIGNLGNEVHIYRGVPYAAPPVGNLRWKPPQPVAPWLGIRECTVFGKSAPQPTEGIDLSDMPQSEDCLYLNVLTPAKRASDNLPVMVWLHGGGYARGSGSRPLYNLPRLPRKRMVLVTVNMRLGPIGLLAHPLLSKESPKGISGNYMFFDMIAALHWVQRNIASFGGDPGNVTIAGVSGGGGKVACLIASPLANGLFHRGICESGAATSAAPIKDLEAMGEKFFARLGVDKEADPLRAARALPWEKIIAAESGFSKELGRRELGRIEPIALTDPAIDGQFLADVPANVFRAGKQNRVPLITCANLGELSGPGSIVMPFLIPYYVGMLDGVNRVGQRGYACIFDQVPGRWKKEGCVSSHAMELGYVFGDWDGSVGWWPFLFNMSAKAAGAKTLDPGLTDADRKVSENMMAMWVQFARTGDPNVEGLVTWPPYKAATDQYLYIANPLQVRSGFSKIAQKQ